MIASLFQETGLSLRIGKGREKGRENRKRLQGIYDFVEITIIMIFLWILERLYNQDQHSIQGNIL